VTTTEIIDQIQVLILEDRRISAKSKAEQLGILRDLIDSVIKEELYSRKTLRQVGPELRERGTNLNFFRHNPNYFLSGAIDDNGRNQVISL
jgi:hypothetical protein